MTTSHRHLASSGGAHGRRHRRPFRPSWRIVVASGLAILSVYTVGYVRTEPARRIVAGQRPPRADYEDGTYSGWGRSRHGRVLVTLVVKRGRIAAAGIADCRMKYPCSMIDALPPQVMIRQGGDVDIVSGATNSTEAFSRAVDDALSKAVRSGRPR